MKVLNRIGDRHSFDRRIADGGIADASFLALRVDLHSQRSGGRNSQLSLCSCGKTDDAVD